MVNSSTPKRQKAKAKNKDSRPLYPVPDPFTRSRPLYPFPQAVSKNKEPTYKKHETKLVLSPFGRTKARSPEDAVAVDCERLAEEVGRIARRMKCPVEYAEAKPALCVNAIRMGLLATAETLRGHVPTASPTARLLVGNQLCRLYAETAGSANWVLIMLMAIDKKSYEEIGDVLDKVKTLGERLQYPEAATQQPDGIGNADGRSGPKAPGRKAEVACRNVAFDPSLLLKAWERRALSLRPRVYTSNGDATSVAASTLGLATTPKNDYRLADRFQRPLRRDRDERRRTFILPRLSRRACACERHASSEMPALRMVVLSGRNES